MKGQCSFFDAPPPPHAAQKPDRPGMWRSAHGWMYIVDMSDSHLKNAIRKLYTLPYMLGSGKLLELINEAKRRRLKW